MLQVRFAEVTRTVQQSLGFNAFITDGKFALGAGNGPFGAAPTLGNAGANATFPVYGGALAGNASFEYFVTALRQNGLLRILAEPNLTAISGQQASFLAGGEFPFPIPNGQNGVTIDFRQFGVKLDVTPVVEDNGQIQLKVAPEVSELDPKDGVDIGGFQVPAISIRRATTQVELADGQSFAIAGLFQRNYSNTINQIPGASKVPVLGALFRSADWQRNETELVIIVTPHLSTPVDKVEDLPNPLKESTEASAIDVILDGKDAGSQRPSNPDGDLKPVAAPPAETPASSAADPAPPSVAPAPAAKS
jgi:pilus assembly protein CpaC